MVYIGSIRVRGRYGVRGDPWGRSFDKGSDRGYHGDGLW